MMKQVKKALEGEKPNMVVFDCNPTSEVIASILRIAYTSEINSE
jgi:hypothetical protein